MQNDVAVRKTGSRGDGLTATRFEAQMLASEPTEGFFWNDLKSPEMFKVAAGTQLTGSGNQAIGLGYIGPFSGIEASVVLAASAAGAVKTQTILPPEFAAVRDRLELWVAVALNATQTATDLVLTGSFINIGDNATTDLASITKEVTVEDWNSVDGQGELKWIRYNLGGNKLKGGALVTALLTRESTDAVMTITGAVWRARRHFQHPERQYR